MEDSQYYTGLSATIGIIVDFVGIGGITDMVHLDLDLDRDLYLDLYLVLTGGGESMSCFML